MLMKVFAALGFAFSLGCQSAQVAPSAAETPPANLDHAQAPSPDTTDWSRATASPPSSEDRLRCWREAQRLGHRERSLLCGGHDPATAYSCWRNASGLDNDSAAFICASPRRTEALACWRAARRQWLDAPAATVICLSEAGESAIPCWKGASGLNTRWAALLCASPNAQTDIQCWRGARWVENRDAADLCFSGSRSSDAYFAWRTQRWYEDEKEAVDNARKDGLREGKREGKKECD